MPPDSLTVKFGNTTYQMPGDASDDEITEAISNHQQAMNPPALKRPQVEGLDYGTASTGTFRQHMANPPAANMPEVAGGPNPGSLLERGAGAIADSAVGLGKSLARGSAPAVGYNLLRKAKPSLPEITRPFAPSDALNVGMAALPGGEGESAALDEAGSAPRRSSAVPAPVSGAADTTSASSASKLLTKIPGKTSVLEDVGNLVAPTATKRLTSIKNILQRFGIGRTPEAPEAPEVSGWAGTGDKAKFSGQVKEIPPSTQPAPAPNRLVKAGGARPPLWKGITDQAKPEVETEAEQPVNPMASTSRRMKLRDSAEDRDIQNQMEMPTSRSLLKRTRPNSITEDLEPEGPKRAGTGPGAMLRRDAELPELQKKPGSLRVTDPSAMGTINKDIDRRFGPPRGVGARADQQFRPSHPDEGEATFNREIEIRNPGIGYHAVGSPKFLKKIGQVGLRAHTPQGFEDYDAVEIPPKGVYFSSKPDSDIIFSNAVDHPGTPILKARTHGLRTFEDPYDQGDEDFYIKGHIPPERLTPAPRGEHGEVISDREDRLDDQAVKQRIETLLRRKHNPHWGSIAPEVENAKARLKRAPASR